MNIYLIPYTGMRHLVMALVLGAAGLLAWWWVLFLQVQVSPALYASFGFTWSRGMEGPLFVGTLVCVTSAGTLLAEGALRRRALRWRFFYAAVAAMVAFCGLMIGWGILSLFTRLFVEDSALLADPSLVTLRYRLGVWLAAGLAAGGAPFFVRWLHAAITRRWEWGGRDGAGPPPAPTWLELALQFVVHVGGGLCAGAFAAAAWHFPGYYNAVQGDLYVASAAASFTFGAAHGLLVWPIPDDLYAGWVRVLSYERYGLRIPIPHTDGSPAERFIGHFPRGLDLYLPLDRGVAELHASFVKTDGRYTVRGLTIQPTLVKRTLERIDLRYDPRRPAPLETELGSEDRVLLGDGGATEVEFLMLPKEER
ncbi:MAG: hypothetical protein R3F59_00505 [Myxococcota bacterium]